MVMVNTNLFIFFLNLLICLMVHLFLVEEHGLDTAGITKVSKRRSMNPVGQHRSDGQAQIRWTGTDGDTMVQSWREWIGC